MVVVPDLVLFEVLRGFRGEREHRQAERLLLALAPSRSARASSGEALALRAVQHDRALLHRDADFDAFERLRWLRIRRH